MQVRGEHVRTACVMHVGNSMWDARVQRACGKQHVDACVQRACGKQHGGCMYVWGAWVAQHLGCGTQHVSSLWDACVYRITNLAQKGIPWEPMKDHICICVGRTKCGTQHLGCMCNVCGLDMQFVTMGKNTSFWALALYCKPTCTACDVYAGDWLELWHLLGLISGGKRPTLSAVYAFRHARWSGPRSWVLLW